MADCLIAEQCEIHKGVRFSVSGRSESKGTEMSKWVKRTSLVLLALALLGVVTTVVGKALGERKMVRNIVLQVAPLGVAVDAGRIEHGRYLYDTRGCAECHGVDGAAAPCGATRRRTPSSPCCAAAAGRKAARSAR
jgi:hypothetical protein